MNNTAEAGKAPLNFKINAALKRRLMKYASRQGLSQAAVVIMALDRYLPEDDTRRQ